MKNKLFTLPNMLTLANLACGCAAIVYASYRPEYQTYYSGELPAIVFWLVAAAAVFDFLDGLAARLTGQYSEIGKQLDSLADVVSFGVAPSAMLFSMYQLSAPAWSGLVSPPLSNALGLTMFAVALFSALRLAKFNVDETQREEFSGLPTPAAGLAIAGLPMLWPDMSWITTVPREAFFILAAAVSYLLICPLRMFSLKFKNFGWSGNELRYTFLASSAVLVAVLGIGGVAASVGLYVIVSAVRHVARMRQTDKN